LFEATGDDPGEGRFHVGPGAAVAVLKTVDDAHEGGGEKWGGSTDSFLGFGGEMRAFAVMAGSDETRAVEDRPRVRGLFTLGVVLESMVFSELF
jgi:hypothetical protein